MIKPLLFLGIMLFVFGCIGGHTQVDSQPQPTNQVEDPKTNSQMDSKTQESSQMDSHEEDSPDHAQNAMQETTQNANSNEVAEVSGGYQGKLLAGSTTPYVEFNKQDYDKALSEGKTVYLYFYANWCSICVSDSFTIKSAFNDLDNKNAVGFQVNFKDSQTSSDETDLARQFGVPYQHTTIILNNKGDEVFRTLSPMPKQSIIDTINSAS